MPRILIYETESPATMVRAESLIKGLFGMRGSTNEGAGYRFSMSARTGYWSFENPVVSLAPGRTEDAGDMDKAVEVAGMLFQRFNDRAANGPAHRAQSFPRLFQTELLKLETCVPYVSPSDRRQLAWDITYRVEVRPDKDSEPVRVEGWELFLRITVQGVLNAIRYSMLPVKREELTDRISPSSAIGGGIGAMGPVAAPAMVYRYANGRLTPYHLLAHATDDGSISLHYPASIESPEPPAAMSMKDGNGTQQTQPPPMRNNLALCLYLIPHEVYTGVTEQQLKNMADRIIDNITEIWDGLTYVAPDGTQTRLTVSIDYVEGPIPENANPNEYDLVITVDDPVTFPIVDTDPTHADRSVRSYACLGYFQGYFTRTGIFDTHGNMPAHEFGHMLGLQDRYHYYQVYRDEKILNVNGGPSDPSDPDSWGGFMPMLLPGSHDRQYDFRDNLMSVPHTDCVTNAQLEVVLDQSIEVLPVHQFTYLGGQAMANFENRNPTPGIGLFLHNGDGSLSFATTDVPTSENRHVFCHVVRGDNLYDGPNNLSDRFTRAGKTKNSDSNLVTKTAQRTFVNPTLRSGKFFTVISFSEPGTGNLAKIMRDNENSVHSNALLMY
ncbi:MAG: hypothetical protein K9J06_04305 [Flavobacteriales bacterium]|nr:hypothetical protein [Flavobacteriales bacterium]